jgi:hypothetical protein
MYAQLGIYIYNLHIYIYIYIEFQSQLVAYIFCLYHIHKPTGLPAHRRLINDLKAIRKDLESSYSELVNTQSKFVEHPPTVWGSQPSVN